MSNAPVTEIDLAAFTADPYPVLARMRAETPITYVPQLGATLFTRRDDIHIQEKRTDVFSSVQPEGLMTRLMGENMMRKEGDAHQQERRALFPVLSPRTVQNHWKRHHAYGQHHDSKDGSDTTTHNYQAPTGRCSKHLADKPGNRNGHP